MTLFSRIRKFLRRGRLPTLKMKPGPKTQELQALWRKAASDLRSRLQFWDALSREFPEYIAPPSKPRKGTYHVAWSPSGALILTPFKKQKVQA